MQFNEKQIMSEKIYTYPSEQAIAMFWQWFTQNQTYIYQQIENPAQQALIFSNLREKLGAIDQNLNFDFSGIDAQGKREFIICADGMKQSFGWVKQTIAQSPHLAQWIFTAFRPQIQAEDFTITVKGYEFGFKDILFRFSTENNALGVELHIRDFDDSEQMTDAVFLLLDALLGEYDASTVIDWIEWRTLDQSLLPILERFTTLKEVVERRKARLL